MNELVLLLEKFLDDYYDRNEFSREDISNWAMLNMKNFYSTKLYMFITSLTLITDAKPNKYVGFNLIKIKSFLKLQPQKFDEWLVKHCESNKLNLKEIKLKLDVVKK